MECILCNKKGFYDDQICTDCKGSLSIKKYKKSDIMQYKSADDVKFIINAITLEDLFT